MAPVIQMFAAIITAALLPGPTSAHDIIDINFAVTVSSQLRGGNMETLCMLIPRPSERVCVSVTLDMPSGGKRKRILEESVEKNFFRCFDFKVPRVSSRMVANITVVIEGEDDKDSLVIKKGKVLIVPPTILHIVRTDKPIYKPGQTVMFRIVSMDTDFIPVKRVYKVVELLDPNANRIAQWLHISINGGIFDLAHWIIPEAVEGTYMISADTNKGERIIHRFKIEKFVLPKYEVQLQLPGAVTVFDKVVTLRICGKYTYGKPVSGSVKAVFCREGYRYRYYWRSNDQLIDRCKTFNLTTDASGCASQTVDIAPFFTNNFVIKYFEVTAELEEIGTGVTLTESGRIDIRRVMRRCSFVDAATSFKHGLPFEAKVKLTGPDDKPVSNETLTLNVNGGFPQSFTLTTDSRGMATFSLDTIRWKNSASIRAQPKQLPVTYPSVPYIMRPSYPTGYLTAMEFYSRSKSFVQLMPGDEDIPCDKDVTLYAQYIIQGKELREGQGSLKFYYLVMSRGEFKQQGRVKETVEHDTVNKGKMSIRLDRVIDLAPIAQVVVYTVLESGEVVADSRNYPVQLCFKNKVSLKFPFPQQLPAEKTKLRLQAEPGSLCSVRAIDLSVLLLEDEQDLTVDYMYSRLPLQKLSGYYFGVEDNEPYPCLPEGEPPLPLEALGLSYRPQYYQKNDVYSSFKEMGIKIVTNMKTKKPRNCEVIFPTPIPNRFGGGTDFDMLTMSFTTSFPRIMASSAPSQTITTSGPKSEPARVEKKKEVVRKLFPETWIWDLVPVGDDGWTNVVKTVPDTITKWVAGAFCVSPVGFGVSPNTGLTAFKPFFVSLTLPYSVIRGESFTLRATVFNYLSQCIVVKVTLADSKQFTDEKCKDCQYKVCLCGEESRTFEWIVTPTALGQVSLEVSAKALKDVALCENKPATFPDKGRKDTVLRKLLVEAEGEPQTVSHNALLCPANGPVDQIISLVLPKLFVEGSEKATVSVLGDLMGRALKNIDKLLQMPYGCGEQNMLKFAPNIFILKYLKSTKQLTDEIRNRAIPFLQAGYQKELKYKHRDGSYSAFGERDTSGNTWLTAFVMKSFGGAHSFTYVDNKHIDEAKIWLSKIQGADGCIMSVGKLFHNAMKGGVKDEVTLTAYVIAAWLEIDDDVTDAVVQNGLKCLKTALDGKVDNLYTTALLSYTFTLAKDEKIRLKLIQELHSKANVEGGTRHWVRAGASKSRLDSLEVEMTSYVLLALLSGPALPGFELGYSASIARWLVQQQNPYGGFSSTQDTVVALQALAMYATSTHSEEGKTKVTVKPKGGKIIKFIVNERNRLLYQEKGLSQVPGEYTVKAEGKSCVLVQISMSYNIPPPADFTAFSISVTTNARCNISKPQFTLTVQISYQGPREETNMVILDIKLLSGYSEDQSSLQQLENNNSVKRVDLEDGHVLIYLDELLKKKDLKTFSLTLEEEESVRDLKPAVIKVYDYYQTSDEAVSDYTSPCAGVKG